jgi:hypothetical protein
VLLFPEGVSRSCKSKSPPFWKNFLRDPTHLAGRSSFYTLLLFVRVFAGFVYGGPDCPGCQTAFFYLWLLFIVGIELVLLALARWDGGCPTGLDTVGGVNNARHFIRREDDEPPRTPPESSFRRFDVKCLKCGSYRLALTSGFDETTGEQRLLLTCSRCRQSEILKVR